jgi:hypothetical protein
MLAELAADATRADLAPYAALAAASWQSIGA